MLLDGRLRRAAATRLFAASLLTWTSSLCPRPLIMAVAEPSPTAVPQVAAAPPPPTTVPQAAAAPLPLAIAVITTGFMLPAQQYISYVDLLADLGIRAVTFNDGASVTKSCRLEESSAALLECAEAEAAVLGLPPTLPLVLLGHSRGAKLSVLTAAKASRPVAAMVLLDPVDATPFEPASTMGTLAGLSVPTAVVGAADSATDCAPTGGNYATFFDTLATSAAPRLLALLPQAGTCSLSISVRRCWREACAPLGPMTTKAFTRLQWQLSARGSPRSSLAWAARIGARWRARSGGAARAAAICRSPRRFAARRLPVSTRCSASASAPRSTGRVAACLCLRRAHHRGSPGGNDEPRDRMARVKTSAVNCACHESTVSLLYPDLRR